MERDDIMDNDYRYLYRTAKRMLVENALYACSRCGHEYYEDENYPTNYCEQCGSKLLPEYDLLRGFRCNVYGKLIQGISDKATGFIDKYFKNRSIDR